MHCHGWLPGSIFLHEFRQIYHSVMRTYFSWLNLNCRPGKNPLFWLFVGSGDCWQTGFKWVLCVWRVCFHILLQEFHLGAGCVQLVVCFASVHRGVGSTEDHISEFRGTQYINNYILLGSGGNWVVTSVTPVNARVNQATKQRDYI